MFYVGDQRLRPPAGEIYDSTEAANGELGFYLVSDNSAKPYRLKCRAPCFSIYQSFPKQITGGLVADVISILGSMNVIAGELRALTVYFFRRQRCSH